MAKIKRAQRFSGLPEGRRYVEVVTDLRTAPLGDQSVAIMGGAVADMVLHEVLVAYRKCLDRSAATGFPSTIPSGFSRKIDTCAKFALFGRWVDEDLNSIREIRNAAAHGLEVFNFDDPEIKDRTHKMHFAAARFRYEGREVPTTSRERFAHDVEWVTDLLFEDARRRANGMRRATFILAGGVADASQDFRVK